MNSLMRGIAAAFISLVIAVPMAWADDVTSADVKKAIDAFNFKDPSMKSRFKSAHGYVVFPDIGKAGFIIGGAGGDGHVFERGRMIGTAELSALNIGATAGVQHYAEVIFFQDKAALDRFRANKLEFDANASAVVAKSGASSSADYRNGVVVFTNPISGAMLEASIGGQKFTFHPKGMKK
ncbi:MAG: YSC84-related protein [bacterium]|jgi:lipid-binding SYLF domain-containing protein